MRKSNFALRLQPSLLEELRGVAQVEDTTLNQFINVAVAEKLAALRTEAYFRERAARADIPGALKTLERLGLEVTFRLPEKGWLHLTKETPKQKARLGKVKELRVRESLGSQSAT